MGPRCRGSFGDIPSTARSPPSFSPRAATTRAARSPWKPARRSTSRSRWARRCSPGTPRSCLPARPAARKTSLANPDTPTDDFLAGFLDDYFAECDEHLTTVRRLLAEAQPALSAGMPAETVEELFRAFHSIKGL